ncbi:PhyH-domain-containing protein [Teratosphaeria nubilosa]|uniref:PhyH-domain-containing protein n=1 Tax=Teratosphaeria nubilosa TaxID=161662 RepID=A0A6G1LNH7_9PEZI|nr:PhyH-domain-containing protein [Teratosphaeria nubilosa]
MRPAQHQIDQFDQQGFLVLRYDEHKLVDPIALQKWTSEVRDLPRQHGKWMPYDEITASGERQIMRTENFVDFHRGFSELLHGPGLAGVLKQVTRDDMLLFKDKINYKLPGGNGFQAHLDAPAYDHIGQIEHTTANLAVDAATLANGCVEVVPGSHRMDVELSEGGRISEAWEAKHTWMPVELECGDLLIFGSHLAHRSGTNETTKPRASVYATYHMVSDGDDLRARYYVDRRENFPPDHERVPGKDYGAGVKRYAFAAPFTKIDGDEISLGMQKAADVS